MMSSDGLAAKPVRALIAALALLFAPVISDAQNPRATNGEINEDTVWVLRALPSVKLDSSMIRLGDVVEPLDAKLAAWPRLSRAIIGLVPVGATKMTLDRDRIATVVNRAEAIPKTIRWFGPKQIQVEMVKSPLQSTRERLGSRNALVRPVEYLSDQPSDLITPKSSITADAMPATGVAIDDPVLAQRMSGWILVALKRQQPDLLERFEVKLATTAANNESLGVLKTANGIVFANANTIDPSDLQTVDRDTPLIVPVSVTGRSAQGPIDALVDFQIVSHPQVVAAARNLQRGSRVSAADLKMVPLSRDRWKSDYSSSIEDFVGMEVRGTARAELPLSTKAVARPLMVQRGELIELRVSGGSILVTTNAKTLTDGRHGEMIEVETLEPRRRVVAVVTGVGTAQITTRAPAVRNR